MESLLRIVQASPNSLTEETKTKNESLLIQALSKMLKSNGTGNINLYIELFTSLFHHIIEHNPNDFDFIKNIFSKTNVITDYKYLVTFIKKICDTYEEIKEPYLKTIIDIIDSLAKKNNDNAWNIGVRAFCAEIYINIYIQITLIIIDGIKKAPLTPLEIILETCQKVICAPLPNNLSESDKKRLFEIIYRYTGICVSKVDPQYESLIALLKKLNTTDETNEIRNLKKFKQTNLKALNINIGDRENNNKFRKRT